MPLLYKALQNSRPSKDGKNKWHLGLMKFKKVVDTQKIGEMIAAKSSLTSEDVHSVIRNMIDVMSNALLNSQTVRLDGFGTFTVIAKTTGKGVDSPEKVSPSQVNYLKIQFTPSSTRTSGGTTRAIYNDVAYERWDRKSASVVADEENQSGNDGSYVDPNS
jgi:predicted histone-like DNA-binding protein